MVCKQLMRKMLPLARDCEVPPTTAKIDRFLNTERPSLPCIVVDLDVVRAKYAALRASFPYATIFYAVKANPAADVLSALATLGARFDLASQGEIARAAADAQVFCRLLVDTKGADWPLTRKFGCDAEMAVELLLQARALGLDPKGLSFHVGSQQTDPLQWSRPIAVAAQIFHACAKRGLNLAFLNVGGGLPAQYRTPVPALDRYAEVIEIALRQHFGDSRPEIIIEPGRYLVGDAGILRSEVLLVARKSRHARKRWVYLDTGRYNGLPETQGERIQYRLRTMRDGDRCAPVVLAGPTCDSTDIIYERAGYKLPIDLEVGDAIDFLSAGAYTASYASVEFNGFAPIRTYCI